MSILSIVTIVLALGLFLWLTAATSRWTATAGGLPGLPIETPQCRSLS